MLYITDIHALNLPCALGTTGDWHHSAIQWGSPRTLESRNSPFGDWGIETDKTIQYADQTVEHANVANHVRACLDMIEQGRFTCAQGMREDFLDGNRAFDEDVFSRVLLLRSRDNWSEIDSFMKREYGLDWVTWKAKAASSRPRERLSSPDAPETQAEATPAGWHAAHKEVESAFLAFLGTDSPFVLKGGASLMFCYGLDRFSENLDFDSLDQEAELANYVQAFAHANGYECSSGNVGALRVCTIRYGGPKPLEIRSSFGRWRAPASGITIVNGIKTYSLEAIAQMKLCAYMARGKVCDLYDVCWLASTHWNEFSAPVRESFTFSLAEKGIEQFEIALHEQPDEFFDEERLLQLYLRACEGAGVDVDKAPDRKPLAGQSD